MTLVSAHDHPGRPARTIDGPTPGLVVAGRSLAVWSLVYMLPHLYWGLGGEAGLSVVTSAGDLPERHAINLVASVVLTLPALIGLGLVHDATRRRLGPGLRLACGIGAALALGHGIVGVSYRVLNVLGLLDIDGRSFDVHQHGWVLWDLLLFEPWFLVEGVLFVAAGRASLTNERARRRWMAACAVGVVAATLTGVAHVRVG